MAKLGSINYQVTQLFKESGIDCRGQSKYKAKQEQIALGAKTSQEIHKNLGIYSNSTAIRYQKVWRQCSQHAKDNYGINDIRELKSEHIKSYMKTVVEKNDLKTIKVTISALGKYETALNWNFPERTYNFENTLNKSREFAKAKEFDYQDRTYQNVPALIDNIHKSTHNLVAQIMHATGCRISEATHIKASQLDVNTNKLYYTSKGGKQMVKTIPANIASKLQDHFASNSGVFKVDQNSFRNSLKHACKVTKQEYTGSHGIRWTFARTMYENELARLEKFKYFQKIKHKIGVGVDFLRVNIFGLKSKVIRDFKENQLEKILLKVSEALGHNRPSITRHYLGFGAAA